MSYWSNCAGPPIIAVRAGTPIVNLDASNTTALDRIEFRDFVVVVADVVVRQCAIVPMTSPIVVVVVVVVDGSRHLHLVVVVMRVAIARLVEYHHHHLERSSAMYCSFDGMCDCWMPKLAVAVKVTLFFLVVVVVVAYLVEIS